MAMWMDRTCGDLEDIIEKLNDRIPFQGPCELKNTKNRRLDRFRRAQNVIHDIFNNGLGNLGRQAQMFGIPRWQLPYPGQKNTDWDGVEDTLAPIFREIVMDAVLEQFGQDGYLKVCHNRSNEVISKATGKWQWEEYDNIC
tara:strand:+ start:94 stop:516 length:423 start_codon:yes stop_codon:yes gene_type:complete